MWRCVYGESDLYEFGMGKDWMMKVLIMPYNVKQVRDVGFRIVIYS